MKLILEFAMENASMTDEDGSPDGPAVSLVLSKIAEMFTFAELSAGTAHPVRDADGNTIGSWKITAG